MKSIGTALIGFELKTILCSLNLLTDQPDYNSALSYTSYIYTCTVVSRNTNTFGLQTMPTTCLASYKITIDDRKERHDVIFNKAVLSSMKKFCGAIKTKFYPTETRLGCFVTYRNIVIISVQCVRFFTIFVIIQDIFILQIKETKKCLKSYWIK